MWYYFILSLIEALLFAAICVPTQTTDMSPRAWIIWTFIMFWLIYALNYFALPVLAWWGFEGVWIETFLVSLAAIWIYHMYGEDEYLHIKICRYLPLVITLILPIIAGFQSCEMFHADKYAKRLKVEVVNDNTFNQDITAIDVKKMVTVDKDLAEKVAEDVLGNYTALGSKVEIGRMTIQQITGSFTIDNGKKLTFENDLIWVAPLEHKSVFKWLSNDVTPGYVIVDATDANNRYLVTEVNGKKLRLKYLESGWCSDDIERHIKTNGYLHRGLNDHCFEIDGNGTPFWVLSSYIQTIGFCGEESEGPITVNAETGEIKQYTIANAPAWIDRIQPESFVTKQIRQWGEYQKGWWNSTFFSQQEDVLLPTRGMSLVYSNGRSYWYTGIRSAGMSDATNGFMLVDTRTKAAKFYKANGFNEEEAQQIAKGQAEAAAANYRTTFPVLYNVRGVPTYFMVYKDYSGNIQGYCFVSSKNRQAVGCDKLKTVAAQKYLAMLQTNAKDNLKDSQVEKTSLIATIKNITLEDGTYYILLEEKSGFEFTGKSIDFPEMKWSKEGDHVNVTFEIGEEKVIPLADFDNIDFEI